MPWFKVDDNLAFHAKVVAAGNPAMGLWVRAGSWCAQQLTDGYVADHMLAAIGTPAQAKRLVDVGLWDRASGGYKFHGWTERQPSKGDVEAERSAARDRMRSVRAKKKGVTQIPSPQVTESRSGEQPPKFGRSSGEVRDSFALPDPVPVPVPVPSRPDPTRPIKNTSSADADGSTKGFDEFWNVYGKKVGKAAALKAWKATEKKAFVSTIIQAAIEHAAWHVSEGTEDQFYPHAATWLNGERWNDERTVRESKPKLSTTDQRVRDNLAVVERLRQREQQQETQTHLRAIGTTR